MECILRRTNAWRRHDSPRARLVAHPCHVVDSQRSPGRKQPFAQSLSVRAGIRVPAQSNIDSRRNQMGTQFAKQSRGRWLRGLPLFTIMLTVGAVAQADVFLNAYTRAQPVIERAVDAYGGVETVTSITSIHYREDNTASQRYQSRKLGPPFDTAPGATEIAWDRSSGNFLASFGGQFPAIQLVIGEDSQQIDMTRKVSTPPGAPIDPNTHFIHRIVPAMLAAKLYQRAQNVTWTGQTKIDGRLHDVLSIAWDTGQVYMVHIDAETGLIGRYDILLTDFVVGDAIAESYFEGYEDTTTRTSPGCSRRRKASSGWMRRHRPLRNCASWRTASGSATASTRTFTWKSATSWCRWTPAAARASSRAISRSSTS
jgi:hypothetical protein